MLWFRTWNCSLQLDAHSGCRFVLLNMISTGCGISTLMNCSVQESLVQVPVCGWAQAIDDRFNDHHQSTGVLAWHKLHHTLEEDVTCPVGSSR